MAVKEELFEQPLSPYTTNNAIWKSPFFFSPTLMLLYIAIIGLYTSYRASNQPPIRPNIRKKNSKLLFKPIFFLSCLISLTFLTDIIVNITRMVKETNFNPVLGYYSSISFLIWISNTYYLMKQANKYSMWQVYQCVFYGLVIVGETMIGLLWLTAIVQSGRGSNLSIYDKCLLFMFLIRYPLEASITLFSFIRNFTNRRRNGSQSETTHLISSTRTETYGSTIVTTTTVYSSDSSVSTKLFKTLPFIWPDDNFELQARLIICIFLMLAGVAINVLTPVQVGYVVDHLEGGPGKFAWVAVAAYAGLKFFQGGSGVLKITQTQIWEPVEKHLLTEISTELKEYLDGLSREERAYMKMDDAQQAIIGGAKCIIQLLSQVSFHIFPLLATMVISITVLGATYSFLGGLIVFITMITYMYLTITITENKGDKSRNAKNSAVLSFTQNSVISTGILVGSLWFGWQISKNKATPGDFVVFNLYIMQLCTPLRFLGTYYRMTQKSFKNLGKMSMLFTNKETSSNIQEVDKTSPSDGHIVFDRVQFGYDGERDIFKNLTFTVKKDAFVAVVGPSGCGKSTLMRLIFRFYDPLSGHIYVNGHDSKKIEHSTLRQNIGFIPQNMILFNDTVLYNIRHGNIDASDEDVFHAAKVAQIHDEILKFPNRYDTKLGERGYKISDSVKQRLAIARAILKNPNLLLLDESTSAIEAETEKSIQKALADFSDNCTVFFATRRLSSIVNADVILVMKNGRLVEFGSHEELLEKASRSNTPSLYCDMWKKHLEELKSKYQDNKIDSTLKIAKDKQSQQTKTITHNIPNGKSSNPKNISRDDSHEVNIVIPEEAPNLAVLGGSTTSAFPALTTSTITTYTDLDDFKAPQFSVSVSDTNYLTKVYENKKASDNEFRNQTNIRKKRRSLIKPTRPILVEPSSSLSSSNFAELIVPTLLESGLNRFDRFITVESGVYPSSNTATCNATTREIHSNENIKESSHFSETTSNSSSYLDLYTGETSNPMASDYNKSNTEHIYSHTQFTIPTSVMPKPNLITSNIAELVLPVSSKSNLRKFSKTTVDKSKIAPFSDEVECNDASISHLPKPSIVNSEQEPYIKADRINKTRGTKFDTSTNDLQDLVLHVQLTPSELVEPVSSITSSKPAEIIVPEFSDSSLRQLNVKTHESTAVEITRESPLKIYTPHGCNADGTETLTSIQRDICVTAKPVSSELNKPTSSLISSKSAELIVPEFSSLNLKKFSKSISNEPNASSLSESSELSKTSVRREPPEVVFTNQRLKYDEYNLHPNTLQKLYTHMQLNVLPLIESKSNHISSNVGELIVPHFTESTFMEFSKNVIKKTNETSSSRDIKSTDTTISKLPAPLIIKTSGESSSIIKTGQESSNNRNNTQKNFPKSTSCPIKLSRSEFKSSTYSQKSSNSAEIIVPVFLESRLKQFSKTIVDKSESGSTSKISESATSKNNNASSIKTNMYKNSNIDTLEFKETTTTFLSSNNSELTVPILPKSFVNKLIKTSKRNHITATIPLETDEGENEVPVESERDNTINNSIDVIENYNSKNAVFVDKCSTRSTKVKYFSSSKEFSSKKSDTTTKNVQSNPSKNNDLCAPNNARSNEIENSSSYAKRNSDSSFLKSLSKSIGEAQNETVMYYPSKIELFSHLGPDVLYNEKRGNSSVQGYVKSNVNNSISSEHKEPKYPKRTPSGHKKLQKEIKKPSNEPECSSLVEVDRTNPEATAPSESKKSRGVHSNLSDIPKVPEIDTIETFDSVITKIENQDDLKPQEKTYCDTLESNISMLTDLKEMNEKEFNPDYYHGFNTSKSAAPSATTVVQLEVSKSAELSTAKFHKVDVLNYIKSEPTQADEASSKNTKLRQRITFKSDTSGTLRSDSCRSKKKDDSHDYIIEINNPTESVHPDNNQPQECSAKAQSNRGTLHLLACDRNWKSRFRSGFPTSVLAIESFISANARLYVPRTGNSGTYWNTDLVNSISHILYLYEDDSINIVDMSIVAPIMPTAVDVSIQIQLLTSENVKFDIPKNLLFRLDKFKQVMESDSVNKRIKKGKQVNIPETNCDKQSVSNTAVSDASGLSKVAPTIQQNSKTQTVNISEGTQETAMSSTLSSTHDSLEIRKFNKAKHVQLYTPILAKLVSFDITANLSDYIIKKSPNPPESYTTSSIPKTSDTITVDSNIRMHKNIGQNYIEAPEASSSKPISGNIAVKKRCSCKRHRTREFETIEIIVNSDAEERSYNSFQIEYIELYDDSSDESTASDTEGQIWIRKLLRKNKNKRKQRA